MKLMKCIIMHRCFHLRTPTPVIPAVQSATRTQLHTVSMYTIALAISYVTNFHAVVSGLPLMPGLNVTILVSIAIMTGFHAPSIGIEDVAVQMVRTMNMESILMLDVVEFTPTANMDYAIP